MLDNINAIVQSVVKDAPLRRRVERHAAEMNQDYGVDLKRFLEIGTMDAEILSYIWLAIDAGQNVLITGPKFSGKMQLLFALSPLVPKHEKVLVFGNGVREIKYYSNFVSFVSNGRVTGEQIESSKSHNANRIILDKIQGSEARGLFSCANYGISFLTTLDSALQPRDVIEELKRKPMKVKENTLNMLDVVISMDSGQSSVWKINQITEFRWLSRTEMWIEEASKLKDFGLKPTNIVENGVLRREAIRSSKALEAHNDINLISRDEGVGEFDKRTVFLRGLPKSGLPTLEYINSYFGVEQDGQRNPQSQNL